jgi:hypothetical protein
MLDVNWRRAYNWSDQYIMENMNVVYARYTVDYDNKKVLITKEPWIKILF